MITDTPTMKQTLESILETVVITDNILAAVKAGEITEAEARQILDGILS